MRAKNLDLAIQQIEKDYGSETIRRLGDATVSAVVDFEAAQEAPLTGTGGISTVNTVGFTNATTGRQQ